MPLSAARRAHLALALRPLHTDARAPARLVGRSVLRIQLRLFLHRSRFLYRSRAYHDMLAIFSPALRAEAAWVANGAWVGRVWFLRGLDRHFLVRLALEMRPAQLCQGEIAPAGELMYVLQHGVAVIAGTVKTASSVWGDDVIMSDRSRRSRANARAISETVEVRLGSREGHARTPDPTTATAVAARATHRGPSPTFGRCSSSRKPR